MFKTTINVTDLKSANTLLAELTGEEAIHVLHRGSESKVIITRDYFDRLTSPDTLYAKPADVKLGFDPKSLISAKSMTHIEDGQLYTVKCLCTSHNVTLMAHKLFTPEMIKEDLEKRCQELADVVNRLHADGILKGFLSGDPVFTIELAPTSLASETMIVSMVLVAGELPEYAKSFERKEGSY